MVIPCQSPQKPWPLTDSWDRRIGVLNMNSRLIILIGVRLIPILVNQIMFNILKFAKIKVAKFRRQYAGQLQTPTHLVAMWSKWPLGIHKKKYYINYKFFIFSPYYFCYGIYWPLKNYPKVGECVYWRVWLTGKALISQHWHLHFVFYSISLAIPSNFQSILK